MAYLFAHYVWSFGTNLNAFYIYKKKVFGDLKSKASKYDALDRESAEQEYINRFNSIAIHNKSDVVISDNSFSSQSIIDEFLQDRQIQRARQMEDDIINRKTSTLNMLNNIYNNDDFFY